MQVCVFSINDRGEMCTDKTASLCSSGIMGTKPYLDVWSACSPCDAASLAAAESSSLKNQSAHVLKALIHSFLSKARMDEGIKAEKYEKLQKHQTFLA